MGSHSVALSVLLSSIVTVRRPPITRLPRLTEIRRFGEQLSAFPHTRKWLRAVRRSWGCRHIQPKTPLELMRFCNSLIVLRSTRLIMVDSMLMLKTRAVSATPSAVR